MFHSVARAESFDSHAKKQRHISLFESQDCEHRSAQFKVPKHNHISDSMHLLRGIKRVCVAISGGVDSSVAALRLLKTKERDFEVIGVHMSNWDHDEDEGRRLRFRDAPDSPHANACPGQREASIAQDTCDLLGIELMRVSFVKEYWTDVFTNMIERYQRGTTPNPDVLCNRSIKFDRFRLHCIEHLGADLVATGHFARLDHLRDAPRLKRGADLASDQSYFLSMVNGSQFDKVLFPVGDLTKEQIRSIARDAGLPTHSLKSSTGLCFVGNRDFGSFLEQYIKPQIGSFVSVEGDPITQRHRGHMFYTIGQRAQVGGLPCAMYVCGRNAARNEVFLAPGPDHPALFVDTVYVSDLSWVDGHSPPQVDSTIGWQGWAQFRYRSPPVRCSMHWDKDKSRVKLKLEQPERAVAIGQVAAFYTSDLDSAIVDDVICLGGGIIVQTGPTCFDRNEKSKFSNVQL